MLRRLLLGLLLSYTFAPCAAAQGDDMQTQVRYLSGTGKDDGVLWDFYCTAGRRSGAWAKIPVPSNWEQHGFGAYNFGRPYDEKTNPVARERGRYRLRFLVPAAWRGKVVRIVFDGVMTDAEVLVNGQPVKKTTPVDFYLNPGAYELTLTMPGYKPVKKLVDVQKGGKVTVDETLAK